MSQNPHDKSYISTGRDVITAEAEALQKLGAAMGDSFNAAVQTLLDSSGHVIVVGIGKSGHIGRKIAASLASTGTPAFFMHPSEAAHGDLGMVTDNSTIIALSYSGENPDVSGVVDYATGLGVSVIAITGGARSSLARKSTIVLELPKVAEACPNGLAPTTSSTMTLAMGDALTVAVMKARHFSSEDFGQRHPGGKLGLGLQRVKDYVARNPTELPLVKDDADMGQIILSMTSGAMGLVGVTRQDVLVGIVTDGDLRRAMDAKIMEKRAAEIMTKAPYSLSPDMRMKDVVNAFSERRISNAFVIDDKVNDKAIIGLIDLKTLLAQGYV